MKYLVTGTAGFVGFHVARLLLKGGHEVVGVDAMTPYYDVRLKQRRHQILSEARLFQAYEVLLENKDALAEIYAQHRPDIVIHLAAQAGVRHSLENPRAYIEANLVGTFNLLELARREPPRHLLLASTSSVYGANSKMPFSEDDRTDHPLTLYAATKKATEEMSHSYAHLFGIPTTAFRFFSVYGPWGRPDMALFKFTKLILADEPIELYNSGQMERDFTYIDDLAQAVVLLCSEIPQSSPQGQLGHSPAAPYRVVNIGSANPVSLLSLVEALENNLGKKAKRLNLPMQPGDVTATFAQNELLFRLTGFRPATTVEVGVARFVEWYRSFYGV